MKINLFKKNRLFLYFLATFYVLFLALGVFFPHSLVVAGLRLSGILICLIYVLLYYKKDLLLVVALSFTMLADIFLGMNEASIVGVVIFCLAQFTHLMRLKKLPDLAPVFFYLSIIVIFIVSLFINIDLHYPLALIYGVTLVLNIAISRKWYQNTKNAHSKNAVLGFSLFLCCDICVAISFLATMSVLPEFLHPLADYFAWVFYLPSQALIANSSKKFAK